MQSDRSSSDAPPRHRGVSVVVPVYNSAGSLPLLIETLARDLPLLCERFELILVNDGSRDDSWACIEAAAARLDWVRGIDLTRNHGQHAALLCGIRAAACPVIATIDDDLQHEPRLLAELLSRLESRGLDVVYGAPIEAQHGLVRNLSSRVTKAVLKEAIGAETASMISAFRVFRTRLRRAFAAFDGPFVNIDVLLTWGTTRFGYVRVPHQPRRIGPSNYDWWGLARHALNMLTGFSVLPLQLASALGLLAAFGGFLALAWVLGRYLLLGYSVPGFPFVASTLAAFSGVQLLALGVIGEYLARMHFRVMRKPSYCVGRRTRRSRSGAV